ncbi:MAG: replicative DNA helicase, partial [Zoogloeaceae bacterium]|nr:replicative DNA helicase [Zoogloeaceae bacterium]
AHIDRIEQRWSGVTAGLMTGLPDLDRRIPGGMSEGDLIILAGRPGMGKTTLAMNIAEFVAGEGIPVGVCSQEMPTSQLIDRSISSLGRVPLQKLIDGGLTEDEHEKMHSAMMRLKGMPLYIDEQGALRIEDVRRKARQIKARAGIGLLIVDYLQLMVGSGENRNQEISAISGALKALAKELRIPVIALSQLSRKCEERPNKRPVMSDLRESGAIEQDADLILFCYRDEVYNPESIHRGLAEIGIGKCRRGEFGGFVPAVFRGDVCRFDSMFGDWPREEREEPQKKARGFSRG